MAQQVKNLPANAEDARDMGLTPGSGRSTGGGNGNPLQYSCLGNPMDRGTWRAKVHKVANSRTWLKWLDWTELKGQIYGKPKILWASLVAQMVKKSAYNAGDPGLIPGLRRFSGEGNGNPIPFFPKYSCLENSIDRVVWQTTVHEVAKSRTQQNNSHFHFQDSLKAL